MAITERGREIAADLVKSLCKEAGCKYAEENGCVVNTSRAVIERILFMGECNVAAKEDLLDSGDVIPGTMKFGISAHFHSSRLSVKKEKHIQEVTEMAIRLVQKPI